jgi:hypothetical protein
VVDLRVVLAVLRAQLGARRLLSQFGFSAYKFLPYTNCESAAKPDGKMAVRRDFAGKRTILR